MYICKCRLDLHLLDQPESLKAKRGIVCKMKERLINRFKISAAEVGDQDLWQRAQIGIAFTTGEKAVAERMLEKIISYLEGSFPAEITDICKEIEKFP